MGVLPESKKGGFAMAAEYMHIGIPVLNKKPNMVYNEWGGFWVNERVMTMTTKWNL